jgi:hypothetical protein
MAAPLSSLFRPTSGPRLPAFERLAPPPPENVLVAELTARTAPGDVVIDLCGRGGWVARSAIGALRRAYDYESNALTRLLAELVLRPPDLRHLDAAIATLALHPRGEVELRRALDEPFSSRCPTCGRPVIVDEFIWATAAAPTHKIFRCNFCRDQSGAHELRNTPVDDEDVARAASQDPRPEAWQALRARLPTPAAEDQLPDELLSLYTPRTLVALEAIIGRLDADLRAAPVDAALRLGLVHALLPLSRLNGYPGRLAALRIRAGHVQPSTEHGWRERNPWLAFEDGCRQVRSFVQRIESGTAAFQPRPGDDMAALLEGSANVVLRTGAPSLTGNGHVAVAGVAGAGGRSGRLDPRSRVRLVLTQPPIRWSTESLSFAYLATGLVLGREAAAGLPTEGLFGRPPRAARGHAAMELRRSLLAVRPALAADARAVVVLDRGGPADLVAGVLGGIGAGFSLSSTLLAEAGNQIGGLLEFELAAQDRPVAQSGGAPTEAGEAAADAPFELREVEAAITDVAVAVLQARGEPASAERLLGEVLVGLDRLGHLRRLAATQTYASSEVSAASDGESDHVRLLIELLMGELRRPDHPRLTELEAGRWWLRDAADIAQARPPLADRLEWSVFGLLSTAGGIGEDAFFERVARMFGGYDAPDEELVRAVLESYRDPASPAHLLQPRDDLNSRHVEHGALVGMLVEYGHRLGLRCWASPHEQRREYRGGTVGDLLSDDEARVYLPLVATGDVPTLEATDCIWYLRGKASFLFEVEWTAMLTEPLLRRGARIPQNDSLVRFLVIPPERAELVRLKLARSPLLRAAMADGNWHILKSNHLRTLFAQEEASLEHLAPMLGLDPDAERGAEQLAFFS